MIKVKQNGKLKIYQTIKANTPNVVIDVVMFAFVGSIAVVIIRLFAGLN